MHAGITSRSERKRCQCSLNPGRARYDGAHTGSKADACTVVGRLEMQIARLKPLGSWLAEMRTPHLHATKVYRTQVSDCASTLALSVIGGMAFARLMAWSAAKVWLPAHSAPTSLAVDDGGAKLVKAEELARRY